MRVFRIPMSSGHNVVHKLSGAAQKHDRELVAHIVDEQRVDGTFVESFAYLVVHIDLWVEQRGLERRHGEIAVEVGRLLLVVFVEQEDHLTPVETTKHVYDELVEPVHGRADVCQRFVLGEFVLAKVLGHGAHGYHGHVPEGRIAGDWSQWAL